MRSTSLIILVALCTNCTGATGPTAFLIREHQAAWDAQRPAHYSYKIAQAGFFISEPSPVITIDVRADTVRFEVLDSTGDTLPLRPGERPTLDDLFADASSAQASGQLSAITFDPTASYPTRMDFSGPPDASGSVFASALRAEP